MFNAFHPTNPDISKTRSLRTPDEGGEMHDPASGRHGERGLRRCRVLTGYRRMIEAIVRQGCYRG
ncbi:hypothetical protein GCM10022267_31430 [Lentzea roselyniae]|uniref:Uncharacterized protein n=1 Tax=Lentzea roselyniae TaxID=531940 RepID=A0ABP7AX13_9PSEU